MIEYDPKIIKNNIDVLMEEKEQKDGFRSFYTDVAKALQLDKANYSKRYNGTTRWQASDIVDLANYFDVSCDRILIGETNDSKKSYISNPLGELSIEYLSKICSENVEYKKLLNIIFSDNKNNFGERLLKTILFYCYSDHLKVSSTVDTTPLSTTTSAKMLKALALENFSILLDDMSNSWYKSNLDKDSDVLSNKIKRDTAISIESRNRMVVKSHTKRKKSEKNITSSLLINMVEDLNAQIEK